MTVKDLEAAALSAHRRGQTFTDFWPTVANAVQQLEPWSRQRYRRLHDRLMHIVICGDLDGMHPIGDPDAVEPWILDDQPDAQAMQRLFGEA